MTTISILHYSDKYCIIEASNKGGYVRSLVKNDKIVFRLISVRMKLAWRNLINQLKRGIKKSGKNSTMNSKKQ